MDRSDGGADVTVATDAVDLVVAGETLVLMPERGVFWPARGVLLVADVHVGKVETFQKAGIPLPSELGEADIARLSRLTSRTEAREVWVLGDLVHGSAANSVRVLEPVVARHDDVRFHLVRGNHDRHLPALPPSWRCEEHDGAVVLEPFVLSHEPTPSSDGYVLAGHLHPMARLETRFDGMRLPCFHFGERVAVLPAFTEFSGGVSVDLAAGRTFAIADGNVVALFDQPAGGRPIVK